MSSKYKKLRESSSLADISRSLKKRRATDTVAAVAQVCEPQQVRSRVPQQPPTSTKQRKECTSSAEQVQYLATGKTKHRKVAQSKQQGIESKPAETVPGGNLAKRAKVQRAEGSRHTANHSGTDGVLPSKLQPQKPKLTVQVADAGRAATKQQSFRDLYVSSVADSFAEELASFREHAQEPVRIDLLLHCIEAGVDIFSDVEQQLMTQTASRPPPWDHAGRIASSALC